MTLSDNSMKLYEFLDHFECLKKWKGMRTNFIEFNWKLRNGMSCDPFYIT